MFLEVNNRKLSIQTNRSQDRTRYFVLMCSMTTQSKDLNQASNMKRSFWVDPKIYVNRGKGNRKTSALKTALV